MLTGIDDTAPIAQALGLLNPNDLSYDSLQITGIAWDSCGK